MIPRPHAAALLSWASAFDNREVTEAAATAWAEALDERVNLADGKAAISAHYAKDPRWIMPAAINAGVLSIRKTRLDAMQSPQPPQSLDGHPGRELTWQRAYREAIGDGETEDRATIRACDALGIPVPAPAITTTRPLDLPALHAGGCSCGCLTRPVRAAEGAAHPTPTTHPTAAAGDRDTEEITR